MDSEKIQGEASPGKPDQATTQNKSDRPDKKASRSMLKNIITVLIVSLLINVIISLFVDIGKTVDAIKQVSFASVIIPFACIMVVYVIDSLRYQIVFRRFNVHLSFKDGLYNNIIGALFSNLTPSATGGQPFQIYHYSKLGLESTTASNVIFSRLMESNIVQLATVIIFFKNGVELIAMAGKGSYLLVLGMLATVLMTVVLVLAFTNPHLLSSLALKLDKSRFGKFIAKVTKSDSWAEKFCAWMDDLSKGFRMLWVNNTWAILCDLALYMVDQLLYAFALYVPLTALVGKSVVPIPEFLLTFILCSLVSAFIPTPGAAGSVEASFVLVLGTLTGMPAETMSAILIWRLGTFYMHILFGSIVYFVVPIKANVYVEGPDGILRRQKKQKNATVATP